MGFSAGNLRCPPAFLFLPLPPHLRSRSAKVFYPTSLVVARHLAITAPLALGPLLPWEGLYYLGYCSNISQATVTRKSKGLLTSSALPTDKKPIYSSRKVTGSRDERGQIPARTQTAGIQAYLAAKTESWSSPC